MDSCLKLIIMLFEEINILSTMLSAFQRPPSLWKFLRWNCHNDVSETGFSNMACGCQSNKTSPTALQLKTRNSTIRQIRNVVTKNGENNPPRKRVYKAQKRIVTQHLGGFRPVLNIHNSRGEIVAYQNRLCRTAFQPRIVLARLSLEASFGSVG